jgi:hypothetical protein
MVMKLKSTGKNTVKMDIVIDLKIKTFTIQDKVLSWKGVIHGCVCLLSSVADPHRKNADADPGKNLNADADPDADPDADADSCSY